MSTLPGVVPTMQVMGIPELIAEESHVHSTSSVDATHDIAPTSLPPWSPTVFNTTVSDEKALLQLLNDIMNYPQLSTQTNQNSDSVTHSRQHQHSDRMDPIELTEETERQLEALEQERKRGRRPRRRLTGEELALLVAVFEQTPKPTLELRVKLAERLHMTPRAVQIWFQNRRAKVKKISAEGAQGLSFSCASHRREVVDMYEDSITDHYATPKPTDELDDDDLGLNDFTPLTCINPGNRMLLNTIDKLRPLDDPLHDVNKASLLSGVSLAETRSPSWSKSLHSDPLKMSNMRDASATSFIKVQDALIAALDKPFMNVESNQAPTHFHSNELAPNYAAHPLLLPDAQSEVGSYLERWNRRDSTSSARPPRPPKSQLLDMRRRASVAGCKMRPNSHNLVPPLLHADSPNIGTPLTLSTPTDSSGLSVHPEDPSALSHSFIPPLQRRQSALDAWLYDQTQRALVTNESYHPSTPDVTTDASQWNQDAKRRKSVAELVHLDRLQLEDPTVFIPAPQW